MCQRTAGECGRRQVLGPMARRRQCGTARRAVVRCRPSHSSMVAARCMQLLDAVLAEIGMAEADEVADLVGLGVLGDGDERDRRRFAACFLGRVGDPLLDGGVAIAQRGFGGGGLGEGGWRCLRGHGG